MECSFFHSEQYYALFIVIADHIGISFESIMYLE